MNKFTRFDSLVHLVSPQVPGCPFPTIIQHIRRSAIEVCETTLAWRYKVPHFVLTPGVYDYSFDGPQDSELHAFITTSVNNNVLHPMTLEDAHAAYVGFPDYDVDKRARPRYIFQIDNCLFGVLPVPDDEEAYNMNVVVALKPTRTADGMSSYAADLLQDLIVHNAAKTLLMIPDSSWSNSQLSQYHAVEYQRRVAEQRARINLGVAKASLSVQMRPLA